MQDAAAEGHEGPEEYDEPQELIPQYHAHNHFFQHQHMSTQEEQEEIPQFGTLPQEIQQTQAQRQQHQQQQQQHAHGMFGNTQHHSIATPATESTTATLEEDSAQDNEMIAAKRALYEHAKFIHLPAAIVLLST